jgi:hypothetical protein
MAQAAKKADVLEFPAGGIADFYMEDDEIEALEREEAKEQFGNNGIANFSDVATRMASYGRYGDDTVAHVETGELVIPKALIDENPKLRDSIFQHLEELGVEDPERYVVGSGANSINPDTGLPEFFLNKIFRGVKKAASKIARGVKKVTKSVVKVVKKAAPLIIPIALNVLFPGMGAIYQGALGAGIGTLVQGGNLKDAFKSALIGGALGGAMEGVKGGYKAAKAGGDFNAVSKGAFDGIKGAARLSNLSEAGQQLMTGQFGESGLDAVRKSALDVASVPPSEMLDASTAVGQPDSVREAFAQSGARARPAAFTPDAGASDASSFTDFMGGPPAGSNLSTDVVTGGDRSFLQKTGDYMFRGGQSPEAIAGAQAAAEQKAIQNTLLKYGHQGPLTTASPTIASKAIAAGEAAAAAAGPGMLATYGPSAALGIGATAALGGFTPPEEPPQEELQTGADLIALNPDEYLLPEETPQYAQGPIQVGTDYGIDPRTGRPIVNPFRRPVYGRPVYAAEGGEIFPRRVGGIMPNEGTPGKDSVRAMLMPGEFVMTTDAVKGLGGGNNDRGINRMYDMMRGLEAKGRAMA